MSREHEPSRVKIVQQLIRFQTPATCSRNQQQRVTKTRHHSCTTEIGQLQCQLLQETVRVQHVQQVQCQQSRACKAKQQQQCNSPAESKLYIPLQQRKNRKQHQQHSRPAAVHSHRKHHHTQPSEAAKLHSNSISQYIAVHSVAATATQDQSSRNSQQTNQAALKQQSYQQTSKQQNQKHSKRQRIRRTP